VVQPYRNREVYYEAGRVIEVSEQEANWLLADAPGCFETFVKEPETMDPESAGLEVPPVDEELIDEDAESKGLEVPPVDKMVKKPKAKK
jgi:hypothetical protein